MLMVPETPPKSALSGDAKSTSEGFGEKGGLYSRFGESPASLLERAMPLERIPRPACRGLAPQGQEELGASRARVDMQNQVQRIMHVLTLSIAIYGIPHYPRNPPMVFSTERYSSVRKESSR